MRVSLCVSVWLCMCVCTRVSVFLRGCVCACMHVCLSVCFCVAVHMCLGFHVVCTCACAEAGRYDAALLVAFLPCFSTSSVSGWVILARLRPTGRSE